MKNEASQIRNLLIKKTEKSIEGTSLEGTDLKNYTGQRLEVFDGSGKVVASTDTRSLKEEQLKKLQELRESALNIILAEVPIVDQLNAALGLASDQEIAETKSRIESLRQSAKAKKAAILSTTTLDELENINIEAL